MPALKHRMVALLSEKKTSELFMMLNDSYCAFESFAALGRRLLKEFADQNIAEVERLCAGFFLVDEELLTEPLQAVLDVLRKQAIFARDSLRYKEDKNE